jgi:hypothetical protein
MAEVEHFYTLGTGRRVDGVVSVDPVALSYVLSVVGPSHVAGFPQTLDSKNVLSELNYIINRARPTDPGKVFLPLFGKLMTNDLLHAPVAQMPALASALNRGALERHIVLWFHDPMLQKLVDGAGYGGRLQAPLSDSLLVDDANLSGTKGDLYVTRHMDLRTAVSSTGDVRDTLTISYNNPSITNAADQHLLKNSGGAYRDYVRVYVPETARFEAMTVQVGDNKPITVAPEAVSYELGRQAIAYWLIVPPGSSAQLKLTYSGPFADITTSPERYDLLWQKQVNALDWPIDVTVKMPDGKSQHWTSSLNTDRHWTLRG